MSAHIITNELIKTLYKAQNICKLYGLEHCTIQVEDFETINTKKKYKCSQSLHL